jgi:hypothetical protein
VAATKPTPTKPKLWTAVQRDAADKYKVHPSAYSNAWASQEYKARGGDWKGPDNRVSKTKKG